VEKYIKFEHKVVEAKWNEERGKWLLKVEHAGQITEDECDVLSVVLMTLGTLVIDCFVVSMRADLSSRLCHR
jgi:hypothetical protein